LEQVSTEAFPLAADSRRRIRRRAGVSSKAKNELKRGEEEISS
jgi:hypothetical protein